MGNFSRYRNNFCCSFYKEATRFPVELVGPSRKEDAILAVIIITVVVFLACFVWFLAWKTMWKNQDIFESLLTDEEKEIFLLILLFIHFLYCFVKIFL